MHCIKYLITISVLVLCNFHSLNAQEWIKVNPIFFPPGDYKTYIGSFANKNNGWWDVGMGGPGSILYTSNGGVTWSKQLDSNEVGCYALEFIDTLYGWFVGSFIPEDEYYILITKDGGKNWNKYSAPTINCIFFIDSLNGFAAGDSIYATTDGGIHWKSQKVESGPRFGILDIFFSDRKCGWAVGGNAEVADAGVILNTVDSGKTWQYSYPAERVEIGVYFKDSLHGCIIGVSWGGAAKTTNDGGKSWTLRYIDAWLEDVVFTDNNTGWIVGQNGFIGHTTDGGLNWERVESGTTSNLYRIFFFENGKLGYIFGADSTLLKYDETVGIEKGHSYKELLFRLSQNYPNPYNPTSTITFDLPKSTYVTLVVYNTLGQLVATLIDEQKQPGRYDVRFDGSKLPSGVYFYRIVAGEFVETKKMVVVK